MPGGVEENKGEQSPPIYALYGGAVLCCYQNKAGGAGRMHCLDKTWQLLQQRGGPERTAQQMSPLGRDRATQGASDDAQ